MTSASPLSYLTYATSSTPRWQFLSDFPDGDFMGQENTKYTVSEFILSFSKWETCHFS